MADQFIDPAVQQNLEKLLAALQGEQERLGQILASAQEAVTQFEGMSTEAYAAQVEQARTLAVQRPPGAGSIAEATAAIREQAAALTDVNRLIAQQVELQARAAAAARTTATETATIGAAARGETAAQQQPPLLERLAARVPVAPAAPALSQEADATSKLSAEQERLLATARAQAAAESQLGAAAQRNILYYTQADNALQRHGALTTDFINAAGRGEVTLREFGDQVGATIGKFAGWTGAAAAVYGAYAAVTQLARGAIDASTTVQQLHRTIDGLDNQQAGQAIIQLAHDTNTSMKEAGDAVFLFSRTFPNLSDAVYAGGLALRAFQLDGVTVADQVKAQTAIHQQFGITAHGLGPIYDELAAGQREYNARITDQIPLLQRSASAVKNAGGDLQTFIELSTIALRTTQLSGSQLGTAFLRSASTFLNPATTKGQSGRAVLASLGIDPNQNYTSLILDALKKAATLSNSDRQKLSLAVFGPLLGGRTAGFFTGGPSLLDEVRQKLSPGAVKGTFLEEFAKELGTSQQQLKALGNNLQQFGAELGQSGLLTPLGLVVKSMNEALTLSTQILRIWSELPGPVKEVAGIVAGAYAVRAVTRGVGLSGVPFFGRSTESLDRAQVSAGLGGELGFYQQQYTSTARNAATAGLATQAAERARNEAVASGTEGQQIAAQQAYERALTKQLQLEAESTALQEQTVALKARINAFQAGLNEGLTAEAAAQAVGVDYRLTTLARGTPVANPVAKVGATGAGGAIFVDAAGAASRNLGDLQAEAQATAEETSRFQTAMGSAGTAVRGVVQAVPGATTALSAGSEAIGAAGGAVTGVVGAVGGWVPALLGFALAAGQIASANQQLDAAAKQAKAAADAAAASSPAADLQRANEALRAAAEQRTKENQGWFAGLPVLDKVAEAFSNIDPFKFGQNKGSDANRQAGLARKAYDEAFGQLYTQAVNDSKSIDSGQSGRDRWYGQLDRLKAQARAFAAGDKNATAPLRALFDALQQLYDNVQQQFRILPVGANPFAQFKTQSTTNIVQGMQAIADRIKLYGADSGSLAQLATAYEYLAQKFANSRNDKDLQSVTQAQSLFVDAVRKDAQDLIDQAAVAGTKGQKLSLLAEARALIESAKAKLTAAEAPVKAEVARLQAAYDADAAALAAAGKIEVESNDVVAQEILNHAKSLGGLTGVVDASVGDVLKSVDAATNFKAQLRGATNATKNKLDNAKKTLANLGNANNQIFSQLDQTLKSINSQTKVPTSGDPFELTRLRREIEQARAEGDPVRQAQIAEQLAQQEIDAARNEHERLQGQLDLANAEKQLNKAIQDRTQAYYTYLESTTDDPVKQATYAIQAARAAIQSAAANGGTGTQAYYDALTKYNQAQDQLAKGIEARKQAYFTYRESETRDPVKQATLELAAATEAVTAAVARNGTGSQAYYEAKAKQNDARNKLSDAHLTVSEDNIQFALDLNKISTQTAINEYEHLLKLHNLTLQQRQDLLRKINDLKKGTSSEFASLDLGTIRLPTPYEIRRAVLAAQTYGASSITNHNDISIHVADERGASAVGVVMDRYVTGTHKAVQRARGA